MKAKFFNLFTGIAMLLSVSSVAFAQTAPQRTIVLKGAPMGGVKFDHTLHLKVAAKCEVCHHASKPEKPLKSQYEACLDCHTKPPTAPVTTSAQAAFHNPTASAGLCIDCHKTENAQGKAAPVKCADCHKKENAQRSNGRPNARAPETLWLFHERWCTDFTASA